MAPFCARPNSHKKYYGQSRIPPVTRGAFLLPLLPMIRDRPILKLLIIVGASALFVTSVDAGLWWAALLVCAAGGGAMAATDDPVAGG